MTLNQFYTALEQSLRDDLGALPHLTNHGALRLGRGGLFYYCPITYVAQRLGKGEFDTGRVEEAAAALELRKVTAYRLQRASDNLSQSQIRQRLEALWKPAERRT